MAALGYGGPLLGITLSSLWTEPEGKKFRFRLDGTVATTFSFTFTPLALTSLGTPNLHSSQCVVRIRVRMPYEYPVWMDLYA